MTDRSTSNGQKSPTCPPMNTPASRQPIVPTISPDMHLNILIPSMSLGGAERIVHDILTALSRRKPTAKLFVLHEVDRSYPLDESGWFQVFRLSGLKDAQRLRTIAMEVLASPSPVLFTHLIRETHLRPLWDFGVQTVPVIHNSQPSWQDPPSVYDHPNVPYVVAVSDAVADQLRAAGCGNAPRRARASAWCRADR